MFNFGYSVFVCPDLKKRRPDVGVFTLKQSSFQYFKTRFLFINNRLLMLLIGFTSTQQK